jgi:hypothetical protein
VNIQERIKKQSETIHWPPQIKSSWKERKIKSQGQIKACHLKQNIRRANSQE